MPDECPSIQCCPDDPYDYRSADATDSEAGSRSTCPEIIVAADPVSGSYIFFPSYVVLTTSHEDALIRYTLDGTDPTAASTLYVAPFEITQAGTMIKARAFYGDCTPGPILTVLYQNPPFPMGLDYSCTTPDKGGTWNVWVPNGNIDNFWQLEFVLVANQAIKRLEMRQLSALGAWDTGIIFSTDSPLTINDEEFDVMPMLLFIAGAQQHTSYQASLGTFGAGTHTWDLYGDKRFSSDGGFWKMDMVLGDDSRVTAIKTTNCSNTVNPTVCPSPALPTVTPKCDGAVDVVFANTVPQNYRVYYSAGSGWTLASSGVTAANPQTVEVTGLTPGALYYFRIELEYTDCGFHSSGPVTAIPKPEPVVTIATDKTLVDPNESFTISWTSTNIGGAVCGGCLNGEVSLNQSLGCKAGNGAGSQATSKATPGVYTYEITGCNTCGTVTASVQVEVRDVAVCVVRPSTVNIANPTTFLCGFTNNCSPHQFNSNNTPWHGRMSQLVACLWMTTGNFWGGCHSINGLTNSAFSATISLQASGWVLEIVSGDAPGSFTWVGLKTFGNSPLGVYTQTGGCATGPATITVT